jgi:hypothetical protein
MCVVFPIGLRQNKRVLGLEGGKKPLQGLRNLRFTYPNIGDSQPLKTWPCDHKNADQNEANLLARNVLRKARLRAINLPKFAGKQQVNCGQRGKSWLQMTQESGMPDHRIMHANLT